MLFRSCDNNAEQIPDMCNEFLMNYMEDKKDFLDMSDSDMIDLTQNMCHWMFINGYTCSKIALVE